ncbi:MAG: hypothetical protein KGL44_10225 [Sphingomonadales bacterium]|nr:hypothetical protein [Sphingomonadales bacterium]
MPAPLPAATPQAQELPWPWIGGGAGLLALLAGGALFALRRRVAEPKVEPEPDVAEVPEPRELPAPAPLTLPEPAFAAPPVAGVNIALTPQRLSATLMNLSADYALELTNTGSIDLIGLSIAADMIGAHASLPAERQLAGDRLALPELHAVSKLAPGERHALAGTLRLPLSEVTPIRQGDAALFVPLLRLRLTAQAGDSPIVLVRTWVLGEPPVAAGGGLRAFRLDLGPRIYPDISARLL